MHSNRSFHASLSLFIGILKYSQELCYKYRNFSLLPFFEIVATITNLHVSDLVKVVVTETGVDCMAIVSLRLTLLFPVL